MQLLIKKEGLTTGVSEPIDYGLFATTAENWQAPQSGIRVKTDRDILADKA